MCESLEVNPLKNGVKLYNLYWDIYLENLKPFDGVYDLLKKYNQKYALLQILLHIFNIEK